MKFHYLKQLSIFEKKTMGEGAVCLPLTYLGPVQLYARYFGDRKIILEQHDHYQKQTYRNRCDILGSNGRLSLIIPVKHARGRKLKMKEVRIDYETDWRRLHWKGIESAYNTSPFFEYYRDTFEPFYHVKYDFLIDLCLDLNRLVINILSTSQIPTLSETFSPVMENDLRELIHPKKPLSLDEGFTPVEYSQVFSSRHGFQANLSIIDLIFNSGPESVRILKESLR